MYFFFFLVNLTPYSVTVIGYALPIFYEGQ